MHQTITDILRNFKGISLEELSRASLMNRIDEKFAFRREKLPEILEALVAHYDVLNINGNMLFAYTSQYFDDARFKFFYDHHRGKDHRHKVRIRTYVDTNTSFLEVKERSKGRTDKKRIPISGFREKFEGSERAFIADRLQKDRSLVPVMINSYRRITLISKHSEERVTIDIDIVNTTENAPHPHQQALTGVVIAELKQPKTDRNSPFYRLMKHQQIRPFRISKFCFGMMDLYGQDSPADAAGKSIKTNYFKPKRLLIQKLSTHVPFA